MFKVIKKRGKEVTAYRLGEENTIHKQLIEEGKIIEKEAGVFEVFSQEAVNGTGEAAYVGDFIKLDSTGTPYPNKPEFFSENHIYRGENRYEQMPTPLEAWNVEQDMCEEIMYLIEKKGLVIDEKNEEKYFTAPLWGTVLSAAKNAVIIFYSIERKADGSIQDVDFNFVQREEFDKSYSIIE